MILCMLFLLAILALSVYFYLRGEFGKAPSAEEEAAYAKLGYYKNGAFQSPEAIVFDFDRVSGGRTSVLRFFTKSRNAPDGPLPKVMLNKSSFPTRPSDYALYWLGHSAAILELDGKRLLFDPVLGNAAPLPFMARRYDEAPIKREDLPDVDYIVITHNHYDHLEKETVRSIQKGHFIVPLGVGAALRGWGIDAGRITELEWGEKFGEEGLEVTAVEGLHFSGRGFFDRNKTLWTSYIVRGGQKNIFWSGDTGYGEHFARFKKEYGAFDLAVIEIDGWNAGWPRSHMFPRQAVQAASDLGAALVLPVHWGVFDLALHPWHESVDMFLKEAETQSFRTLTPKMGEKIVPG
ncbi:MAG: MBL fold metallo-hydrolase, partial [Synergistaceae bacterium]|nr:MBL fold metallo-hydrolase [Synergistaceae bacterium]